MVKILFHLAFALAAAVLLALKLHEHDMTQLANACEVCFESKAPVWWQDSERAFMRQGEYGGCK